MSFSLVLHELSPHVKVEMIPSLHCKSRHVEQHFLFPAHDKVSSCIEP
jgi:hypothetical protein